MTLPLFEAGQPDPPTRKVSPEVRRRDRQAECLARGLHPLTAAVGYPIRLHPMAAPADDRTVAGRRCSTCRFRELILWHNQKYPKCAINDWSRASHGAGTDVRAWWPACDSHQPREEGATNA